LYLDLISFGVRKGRLKIREILDQFCPWMLIRWRSFLSFSVLQNFFTLAFYFFFLSFKKLYAVNSYVSSFTRKPLAGDEISENLSFDAVLPKLGSFLRIGFSSSMAGLFATVLMSSGF